MYRFFLQRGRIYIRPSLFILRMVSMRRGGGVLKSVFRTYLLFHMFIIHSGSFPSTIDFEQITYLLFVSGVCDGAQIMAQTCEGQALSLVKCRSA